MLVICLVASSRVDITALLLCVEHLMWSMCESVEELLRPDAARGSWMWSIHSLCNQLLTVLVILTSPLAELHRWHKSRDKLAGLLRTTGARLVVWWKCAYLFILFLSLALSRVFQGGCGGGGSRTPKFPEGMNSRDTMWLSVMNPTLFTEELLRYWQYWATNQSVQSVVND